MGNGDGASFGQTNDGRMVESWSCFFAGVSKKGEYLEIMYEYKMYMYVYIYIYIFLYLFI